MNEHHWFQPGESFIGVQTNFARLGLSICYDLRFPILFQSLAHAGCNVFLMSAAWPITRINHWNLLLPARAIENQSFFIACNAVGGTHRETFGGSSAIINPWGEVLFQANQTNETVQTIIIDSDETTNIRNSFPVLSEQMEDIDHYIPLHILH
jgi:omega-amidase